MPYKLENWSFVTPNIYRAPELGGQIFHGNVYGHPHFPDGSSINTSEIVGRKGQLFQTYSGSLYELGKVDAEYEKQFPEALNRLMKSVKEI